MGTIYAGITIFCKNLLLSTMDKDRHLANSTHETLSPRGSGVHTVRILQGFVLNFDFGIYSDHI